MQQNQKRKIDQFGYSILINFVWLIDGHFILRSILRNQTGIEDWILEKAHYRHRRSEVKFIYPYNLGRWNNFWQVVSWSCKPKSDGITWEIAEGTDQYTLTR